MNLGLHTSQGISEAQLETWARQGAEATAKATYDSIKNALSECRFPGGHIADVYLQGSYRNSTNIRGDSDVDVVAQFNGVYIYDTSMLPVADKQRFEDDRVPASYTFSEYRNDVESGLRRYYGPSLVTPKPKCIEVAKDEHSNRLGADVVPCFQYRLYHRYTDGSSADYVEGMAFKPQGFFGSGGWIVNFPKRHYTLGVEKNSDSETRGNYKPTIRIFKNARNKYNSGWFRSVDAPSYFVACLLSNVPSKLFSACRSDTFVGTVAWLADALENEGLAEQFRSQNGIIPLFGSGPDQWDVESAIEFVGAMSSLWKEG